jgi:hypothetical protein
MEIFRRHIIASEFRGKCTTATVQASKHLATRPEELEPRLPIDRELGERSFSAMQISRF